MHGYAIGCGAVIIEIESFPVSFSVSILPFLQ